MTESISPRACPLQTSDGHRFVARIFPAAHPRATLAFLPGMGVPAAYYDRFGEALAERGITLVAGELRGHGESSCRPSRTVDFSFREMLEEDLVTLLDHARGIATDEHHPLLVGGHSLGGQLAALHLARHPQSADACVLVAACSTWFRNFGLWPGVPFAAVSQLFRLISAGLGTLPGHRLGFGGVEARSVVRDWAHVVMTGRYRFPSLDYDFETALGRLQRPVVAISLVDDSWAPARAVEHLLSKVHPGEVEHLHLASPSGGPPLDHFRWARHPRVVADALARWLDRSLARLPHPSRAEAKSTTSA